MEMVGGNKTSSVGTGPRTLLPYCGCRSPMRLYVSNSAENPRRRYWKCMNWNVEHRKLQTFPLGDEITRDEAGVIAIDPKPCSACHYAEILLEAGTKKIEKLKMKVGNERKRVFILGVGTVVSWICFVGYECINFKRM